jgi:hypothetical protein
MWVMLESLSLVEKQDVWGAEFGLRYQLNDYLYFDADANILTLELMNLMGKLHPFGTRFHLLAD